MRNHVRHSRSDRIQPDFEEGHERDSVLAALVAETEEADEVFDEEFGDALTVYCPDCARPIAVLADDESLPEHAMCPTPWNPFGLTVCVGSGRAVTDARQLDGEGADAEQELATLLTLPAGLDWRTQPFSHVGGPGSRPLRPVRVPGQRLAA